MHYKRWRTRGRLDGYIDRPRVVSEKRCIKCGEAKPIDQFGNAKQNHDGHTGSCKACLSAYRAQRREHYAALWQAWWEKNGDRRRAGASARVKDWRRRNPEQRRMHNETRRARMNGSRTVAKVLRTEVFERDGYRCWLCGDATMPGGPMADRPSLDHVVPLAKGGAHTIANLRCAHVRCNREKGVRLVDR